MPNQEEPEKQQHEQQGTQMQNSEMPGGKLSAPQLEDRVKKLERLVNMMRFGMIALIAFMIADILSDDTGSKVIFADQIKAREFVLLGEHDTPIAHWDNKETGGLKIYAKDGSHVVLAPESLTFYQDRLNPVETSKYD